MADPIIPVAIIVPAEQEVVVGSIVKLDGRSSLDPNGNGLTFTWNIQQVPIGSQAQQFGITNLEADASIVSFAPDITGIYIIQLTVSDGITTSSPAESIVDVRVILVPHHQGFVPDASFIWNYLSDFWNLVPDKTRFETIWSSMIQVVSSEMLKLFEYQYNRSIRDIQETIQRRWLSFSPALEIDRDQVSFILSEETAGSLAATFVINPKTGVSNAVQPTYTNSIVVPKSEVDLTKTSFGLPTAVGRLITLGNRTFTINRTASVVKSLDHQTDGSTSGTNTFGGSQFTAGMVGSTLRILGPTPSFIGDFIISAFTSNTQIAISNPPIGLSWAGATNLEYTVLPAIAQHSSVFTDQNQVPAALNSKIWRMSSTLISSQLDFGAQGVSPGDVLEIEVTRLDLQVISTFFVQVTAVDRNRLSFSFNLTDLIDGVVAPGLSSDIQVTLAADLIVSGISADINGNLIYALDAAKIQSTVTSTAFKKTYFERLLSTTDSIDVGVFSIQARPVRVLRNNKIAIDDSVVSIPVLQEFIKQPDIVIDSTGIFTVSDDVRTKISRVPYLLAENLDYIIDDESTVTGTCQTHQGINLVTVPFGDLIDRSVSEGDLLEIVQGTTSETFDIRQVVAADTLKVAPVPTITSPAALFTIIRKIKGKFIRFVSGTFTKRAPSPNRLWSEVTYFDNNASIESNFGILVGVSREDLQRVGSDLSYKNAVSGLMYALSRGPTISNLALAGHILVGLPFAQSLGVVREINPEFRTRPDGSPLTGRILIDGLDKNGTRTGITNIYFYPQGRQIFDSLTNKWVPAVPDLSGLAINPATGIAYAVGDTVTQFSPLAKGVTIREYLSTPDLFDSVVAQGNIASQLQKFHSFQIIINSDIISATDTNLVAEFIKKAKAHYVQLISSLQQSLEDFLDPQDFLTFTRMVNFFDNSGLGVPTATKLDQDDDDNAILSIDGFFYTRYQYGSDLVTVQGSSVVTSASGGFLNIRNVTETWDPPLIRPGDLLQISDGNNSGNYFITSVDSDNQVTLDLTGSFQTLSDQNFVIYRPLRSLIWAGKVVVTNGNATIPVQEATGTAGGIGAAGVSVGDLLVFADTVTLNPTVTSKTYKVIKVTPGSSPSIVVNLPPIETSGTYTAWVVRDGLMTSGVIIPTGSSGENFFVAGTSATNFFTFTDTGSHHNSWLNVELLRPGSKIIVDGTYFEVLQFEPSTRKATVSSILPTNYSDKQVTIDLRPNRATVPVSIDFLDRMPSDHLELNLVSSPISGDLVQSTSGVADVTLTVETFGSLGVHAGDYLQFLTGAEASRDVGFGSGIFPIISCTSTVATLLSKPITTGSFRYAIIRKVPNEG